MSSGRLETTNFHLTIKIDKRTELEYIDETAITYTHCYVQVW